MGRTYYHIIDIHISFEFPHDFRRTKRPTHKPWNTTTEITTTIPSWAQILYYCFIQHINQPPPFLGTNTITLLLIQYITIKGATCSWKIKQLTPRHCFGKKLRDGGGDM